MSEYATPTFWLVALVAVVSLVAGAWLAYRVRRALWARRLNRRRERGLAGESEARIFLERRGYRIVEEQLTRKVTMRVDGDDVPFTVRADFLVEKDGRRSVVEVKTGNLATRPYAIQTRRQLLEYRVVFGFDSLFLFDADRNSLYAIEFNGMDETKTPSPARWWKAWLMGLATGMILGAALGGALRIQ